MRVIKRVKQIIIKIWQPSVKHNIPHICRRHYYRSPLTSRGFKKKKIKIIEFDVLDRNGVANEVI